MVVAEAYLPIIFAAVFEVCFQTVMSINNYDTLTAFGTEKVLLGQKLVFLWSMGHVLLKPSGW